MVALLLVAHAPMASAFREAAAHLFADCDACLQAIDVQPDQSCEDLALHIEQALIRACAPSVLILADVFGATPCNVAKRFVDGKTVALVSGLNVPMLWRAVAAAQNDQTCLDEVVKRAQEGGHNGVLALTSQELP